MLDPWHQSGLHTTILRGFQNPAVQVGLSFSRESPASHLTFVKRLAPAQRLGKESRHQIIWADSFTLGAGNQPRMQAFGNTGDELAAVCLPGFGNAVFEFLCGPEPRFRSIKAILDRLLRRFAVGHTAGQIGKDDEKTASIVFGQGANFEGIITGLHRLISNTLLHELDEFLDDDTKCSISFQGVF